VWHEKEMCGYLATVEALKRNNFTLKEVLWPLKRTDVTLETSVALKKDKCDPRKQCGLKKGQM